MTLLIAALPVALLIIAMTSPWPRRWLPLPAHVALPGMALLAYILQLAYFRGGSPDELSSGVLRLVHAGVIDGVLSSLTPLAIVFGAVLLFKTMELSGAMRVVTGRLQSLRDDRVAHLVLVGWAFAFLIEGLSGFGTPAALAAPILVGLGFPPVRVAAMCLVMNSVPVSFGAVGTPVWFGLGEIGLTSDEVRTVAVKAAWVNALAALVIPVLALRIVVPWREIRSRAGFIALVTLATVVPYVLAAWWSVEFPSIIGGICGVLVGVAAARWGIGLPHAGGEGGEPRKAGMSRVTATGELSLARAIIPLVAVVAILGVTRIGQVGVKGVLTSEAGAIALPLGVLGEFWVSPALVVGLRDILGAGVSWRMPVLYVPFVLPFVVVSLAAAPLLRMPRDAVRRAWSDTFRRLTRPAIALAGALVLVKMLMLGGETAPAMHIGHGLAAASGGMWPAFAPLLGALGSFFSGSNTVSNLTFAPAQAALADTLALDRTTILALQTVGGAMGNMVCVHNIVSVGAVLGLRERTPRRPAASATDEHDARSGGAAEGASGGVGAVLRLTAGPMLAYAVVAGVCGVAMIGFGL
jgi:lactate permease